MNIRKFMIVGSAVLFIGACSDAPNDHQVGELSNPKPNIEQGPGESVVGHWLYNPGQCDNELQFVGMYDLKIDDSTIMVGDTGVPMRGEWSDIDREYLSGVLDNVTEWLSDCSAATLNLEHDDLPAAKLFSSEHTNTVFIPTYHSIADHLNWILVSDSEIQWFIPFDPQTLSAMPVADDAEISDPK